jgi:threonine/homoserine/homoserine lactone efflux protein
MIKLLRIFGWGLMISFLGSLPLGTLNVAAMQLGIYEGIKQALLFSFGSLLVEMIYVRISLVGINWIQKQQKLMRIMQWITLGIIVALACFSFYAAMQNPSGVSNAGVNPYKDIAVNRFLLGMGLCAINPVQIPFWFGWSTVLFSKKILEPAPAQYNSYIVGIGLGTLAGNAVFIFGGKYLVERIANSQQYLNWVIGAIFAITAIITLIKILRNKKSTLTVNPPNL